MKYSRVLLVALYTLLALVPQSRAQEPGQGGQFDGGSLVIPPILFELHQLEEQDPEHTVFKVDRADMVLANFEGSLNRVAEYQGVDSGVYLHNLLFLNSASSGLITLEADTAGRNSRSLSASYQDPGTLEVKLSETRVIHRLEHNAPGVDIDFNPGQDYQKIWERVQGQVKVGIMKAEPNVNLFASFDSQSRNGDQQHSFFQLHRFNCTDCHTFSASQGIAQTTNSFRAGVEAALPNRTSLYAAFGGSRYNDNGSVLSFNFGGPFSSAATARGGSNDSTAQLAASTGDENYRLGANYFTLNRTSQGGLSYQGRYFSGNVAYRPIEQVSILAGTSSQDESYNLASNLSAARRSTYLEVNGYPAKWASVRVRLGQDEANYNIGSGPLLQGPANANTIDRYVDTRLDVRPNRQLRLGLRYRDDNLKNPLFTTSPTHRDLLEGWATWSPSPVVLGLNYRRLAASSDNYNTLEETTSAFFNAYLEPNTNLFATYSQTQLNQNSQGPLFLQDALGLPLQLQVGYPYTARLNMFSIGTDLALGEWRMRPYYRRVGSQSQGILLPGSLPSFSDDTRLDLLQNAFGLHFDVPAWEGTAMGFGYERQQWIDYLRSSNDGILNYYTINFRSRF